MADDPKPADDPVTDPAPAQTPEPAKEPTAEPAADPVARPEERIDPQTGHPYSQPVEGSKKFTDAFGDKGAVWFCQGLTFEQAYKLHSESQAKQLADIKAENEKLKQQLSGAKPAGEGEPAEFGSGEEKEKNRKGFASRIRMPQVSTN